MISEGKLVQIDQSADTDFHDLHISQISNLGSFAQTARDWAAEVKPVKTLKEELFSFSLAVKLIDFARSTNDSVVDVPLLPSIQLGSRPSAEQIEFAEAVLGKDSSSLIKKTFSKKGIREFVVNPLGIKSKDLQQLVSEIAAALPDMSVSIVAKRNRYGFAEFFIRLNSNKVEAEELSQMPNSRSDLESQNEKMVAEMRDLLIKRNKQFVEDPLKFEGKALISPSESPLIVDVAKQSYSRLKLNFFAMNVAAIAWFGQKFLAIWTAATFGVDPSNFTISACAVSIYGYAMLFCSRDRLMHRLLVPADKLNDLRSPSIQNLLSEIRKLGYRPKLLDNDGKLRLAVLFDRH